MRQASLYNELNRGDMRGLNLRVKYWAILALIASCGCNPAPVDGICDVPMESVLHKAGDHKATPSYFYLNDLNIDGYRVFEWQVRFMASCLASEQSPHPWNKITGITWNSILQGGGNNTFMFAWRPNFDAMKIELCPYFHNETGDRFHAAFPGGLYPEIPTALVPIDFCANLQLIVDEINQQVTFQFAGEGFTASLGEYGPFDLSGNARYINPWYGGPDPAPVDINYLLGIK